ncbi:MAG TPA: 5-formyltetrahydrofolate cyclo-ligase, partial [Nannocystis exedens]|nr:5-formyltetrahydrofolate cyclo-ligase [Nannocystis exedens]
MMKQPGESVEVAKGELRAALLRRRAAASASSVASRSRTLVERIIGLAEWQQARGVAAFVGVGGEPDTWALLSATLGAGKRLALPRVCARTKGGGPRRLEFVVVDDLAELVRASFGLWEPPPRSAVTGSRLSSGRRSPTPGTDLGIDLILVPGVAFDRRGHRLGFGKGYYDRALQPLRGLADPHRIGVCFADALDPKEGPIPTADHDVSMH